MKRYKIYPETTSFYFCTSTINYRTAGAGHYNPVRKGFVLKPEDWKYSSARNWILDSQKMMSLDLDFFKVMLPGRMSLFCSRTGWISRAISCRDFFRIFNV